MVAWRFSGTAARAVEARRATVKIEDNILIGLGLEAEEKLLGCFEIIAETVD